MDYWGQSGRGVVLGERRGKKAKGGRISKKAGGLETHGRKVPDRIFKNGFV